LQLFCNEWSVDECLTNFQRISITNGLEKTHESDFPQWSDSDSERDQNLSSYVRTFTSRLREALPTRKSSTINSNLKQMFGREKPFFECPNKTKVAITVNRVKDSSTCILANYNGPEIKTVSHSLIRPESYKDEMLVWQV
jgi:hypothetical protein